jgi:hypothetical protein
MFRRLLPAAVAACVLAILPILVSRHLPLLDAPAHESRLVALRDILVLGRGSPFYDFTGFFLPNIAFDIVGIGLVGPFGPETAGQIFFGLTLLLTVTGVWVLNRISIGRWSMTPLASTLFLYNLISILGFFSYAFGLALVPWALAGWKLLEGRHPAARASFSALACVILLFCHVFDFGIYAVTMGGFVVTGLIARRLTLSGAVLEIVSLAPALALFGMMPHAGGLHAAFQNGILQAKLFGLLKSMTCGSMTGDAAFMAGALLFATLLIVASRRGLAPGFALGLAGLAALYVILPEKLATGSYVDERMPIAFALFLLAGLDIRLSKSRVSIALLCLIAAMAMAKQTAIAVLWRSFDPVIDNMSAALAALPAGAVILQAECEPASGDVLAIYEERQPSLTHVAAMAAFQDSRFIPATWAIAGQHTVRVSDGFQDYYALQNSFGSSTCSATGYRSELARIETLAAGRAATNGAAPPTYFLLIRPDAHDPLQDRAALLASGPAFALYRVK